MKVFIDGSERVLLANTDIVGDESTAFLVEVHPSRPCRYEYLIPFAKDEIHALKLFQQGVDNLIDFATKCTGEEDKKEETFETWPDAFSHEHKQKVAWLERLIRSTERRSVQLSAEFERAVDLQDIELVKYYGGQISLNTTEYEKLLGELRVLKTTPLKTERTSVLDLRLRKQREIKRAIEAGNVTATRLDAFRTYPVSYFDDSRGEIIHTPSDRDVAPDPLPDYVSRTMETT